MPHAYGHGVFNTVEDAQQALHDRVEKIKRGAMTDEDWQPKRPSPPESPESIAKRTAYGNIAREQAAKHRDREYDLRRANKVFRERIVAATARIKELEEPLAANHAMLGAAEKAFPGITQLFFETASAAKEVVRLRAALAVRGDVPSVMEHHKLVPPRAF